MVENAQTVNHVPKNLTAHQLYAWDNTLTWCNRILHESDWSVNFLGGWIQTGIYKQWARPSFHVFVLNTAEYEDMA